MEILEPLLSLVEIVTVIVLGIIGQRVTVRLATSGGKKEGIRKERIRTAKTWLTLPWIVIVATGIARVLGLADQLETLTVVGFMGVVLGLMSEHTLTNIVAGFLLFRDDLVDIDDIVELRPGMKGKVVKVGLTDVWIKGEEGGVIIASNEWLRAGPIINYTALERLQGKFEKKSTASQAVT